VSNVENLKKQILLPILLGFFEFHPASNPFFATLECIIFTVCAVLVLLIAVLFILQTWQQLSAFFKPKD